MSRVQARNPPKIAPPAGTKSAHEAAAVDRIGRTLADIDHARNRAAAAAFLREAMLRKTKPQSAAIYANQLRAWAMFLGNKDFKNATREDVTEFLSQRTTERRWKSPTGHVTVRQIELSQETVDDRKKTLKFFMRWVATGRFDGNYPPCVEWLGGTVSDNKEINVLTPEEVRRIVQAQTDPMARAMIATLYDSGTRASEFLSLRIRDVLPDEDGAVLVLPKEGVSLKTGTRRILILDAAPFLVEWLNIHPQKLNRDAPLWINRRGHRMTNVQLYRFIVKRVQEAGIDRHVHPHDFRHARATQCVKEDWTPARLNAFFGWTKGSPMWAHYAHLSGKDYEDKMREDRGLRPKKDAQSAMHVRRCQCGQMNEATNDYCKRPGCNRPLTIDAAERREAAKNETFLSAIKDNPVLLAGLAEALASQAVAGARARKKAQ